MKTRLTSIHFKRSLLFILVICCQFQVFAQVDSTDMVVSSPWSAVYNHLKYLQDESYQPGKSAESISPDVVNAEERVNLAIKLKQVLDGKGIYVDLDLISRENNFRDSAFSLHRHYVAPKRLPELYVEKVGDRWFYSSRSTKLIGRWHKEVFPYGTDKLLRLLPKQSTTKYLGLYLWQYVGLFVLILFTFIFHRIFTFLLQKIFVRLLMTLGYKKLADKVLNKVAGPVSVLILFPLLIVFVPVLQFPIKMNSFIIMGLQVSWPVVAIVFFYRLVDILSEYLAHLATKTETTLDDQLVPLVRKALKTFVVLIGALVILNNLNVNITGIIAGLSIGGLAFALAAQDTIKNFFGSLMIFFDRPFQIGDWITSGDVDGTVEEVGFRATRIRTFRNSVMYIPNGVITNQMIDNHGLRVYRRFFTQLAVKYDTPPEVLEAFTEGLKKVVQSHPNTRKDYFEIHVNSLASTSIEVMFYIFFSVANWSEELKARHETILLIIKLADELGVDFAFPTQTLHVSSLPDKNTPLNYDRDKASLKQKINEFLKKEFPEKPAETKD